jgi:hypothetical protein
MVPAGICATTGPPHAKSTNEVAGPPVAEAVPEAFGLTTSSVSRRFVRASAKALQTLHTRWREDEACLVLLLDGQSFAGDQVAIALGVTTTGEKRNACAARCRSGQRDA